MNTQEIKEYLVKYFNKKYPKWDLTVDNITNEGNERNIFDEWNKTIERDPHRWWDEVTVVTKIGDKFFRYVWAEANRDETVQELGWSFDWGTLEEVEPYEEVITVTKYRKVE